MPPLNAPYDNFSFSEIKQAIKKLKNKQASGSDDITGEMLKTMDEESMGYLLTIMNEVWQK
jgi:hypothetical protein